MKNPLTTNQPVKLFVIGLILTTLATFLVYQFIPTYNYLSPKSFVYSRLTFAEESFTNADLLLRLGIYNAGYWVVFVLVYAALLYFTRIRFQESLLIIHFALSIIAFIFIVCLNSWVTDTHLFQWEPSDIKISMEEPTPNLPSLNGEILFRYSLAIPSSLIGLAFLTLGTGCFLVNTSLGLIRQKKFTK